MKLYIFLQKHTFSYCYNIVLLAKTKMWAEVVQYFTESESSVRSEVQEIDGEDFEVWRWVQPMSPGM